MIDQCKVWEPFDWVIGIVITICFVYSVGFLFRVMTRKPADGGKETT